MYVRMGLCMHAYGPLPSQQRIVRFAHSAFFVSEKVGKTKWIAYYSYNYTFHEDEMARWSKSPARITHRSKYQRVKKVVKFSNFCTNANLKEFARFTASCCPRLHFKHNKLLDNF